MGSIPKKSGARASNGPGADIPKKPNAVIPDPGCGRIIWPDHVGMYGTCAIPERFYSLVVSHCGTVLESCFDSRLTGLPLFLMVEGPPGSGKSYQSIASCLRAGFTVVYASASDLTGTHLSDSANAFSELYGCATDVLEHGGLPAIVIDDLHKGEASFEDNAVTTVNANLLTGRMMNVCDSSSISKIPVIATANSLSGLDEALLRDGRSRKFAWEPTQAEVELVALALYKPFLPDREAIKVIRAHSGLQIASFASALEECRRQAFAEAHVGKGLPVAELVRRPSEYGLVGFPDSRSLDRILTEMEGGSYARR